MSCPDCFKGVLHEGTPKGSFQTLAGIKTYVSLPSGGTAGEGDAPVVVYLGDVFGFYNNAFLLCDAFAENGFRCYFPDYLNDDAIPASAMNNMASFDMATWRTRHGEAETRKPLDAVLEYLRTEMGVKKIGASGYCFGGKYSLNLAMENKIEAAVLAHPSGIVLPDNLVFLKAQSKTPVLINACETDGTWPIASQAEATTLMTSPTSGESLYAPGWKQNYYPGCTHGFASRGDIAIPAVKFGKEDAFRESVEWFKKYLV